MIKMRIDEAKTIEIEACGTIPHIVSEILLGVKTLKDRMDKSTGMGDAFLETLKHGLDFLEDIDNDEGKVDEMVNELVDKALENDDFLEEMMDALPDELKTDFARRLKERARKGKTEEKEKEVEEK